MEIYEEIFLEIEQTNLMLSSAYKKWSVPGAGGGDFTDEYTQDYDILPFRFWYGKPVSAGLVAEAEGFPRISFACRGSLKDARLKGIVENSDALYQGRMLQYQKTNSDKLLPAGYPYFEGTMTINPKD
jgi:hypothetical protein